MQQPNQKSTSTETGQAADDPEPGSPGSLSIELILEAEDTDPPAKGWLEVMLARAAADLGVTSGVLSVALIGDAKMTQMHADHKNAATTTDVLTFDLRENHHSDSPLDGELVLCVDEAVRQATARGHDARVELLLYGVHGLLHLLGFDDQDADEFKQIHEKEDEVLTTLGIGPVFGRLEQGDS